ncbi:hypothetical protein EMIHUDRAFT_212903 [Emiliania huxleyi CCMP1516]|uniref:Arylamine N-acetyltransferase n=2 Tax=Emiliania huxleyi TaxID=2903 RepID=A0A0D3IPH2_EMIH1|nr:hypothetical protein EMIHUDRAFT_212903 [Emiliania huxleyi CCMP1516]EOD13157.1 hypothetical protein EMIHUDRAFT_212903 [Emiliania huxleyi CCMP1516]|eukprot:XP_005765586.1 hypothetical protein EMIHUDRAFT_212903 [Emiliania huxleyi CCMP1516]
MNAGNKCTLLAFLDRIGLYAEAEALIAREPSAEDLSKLLHAFLLTVPFENLGQHAHPALGDSVAAVPAAKHIPSLDVHKTLKKVVYDRRGGFCFELNFAFAWLLRSLGYKVRLSISYVITPGGPVPGHLALFVDGLGPQPLHVDPGFGDAPREPMAAVLGSTVTDSMIGDAYSFAPNDDPSAFGQTPEMAKRCGQVLMRSRKSGFGGSVMVDFVGLPETPPPAPEMTPPEPVYLVNFDDDLALDCDEFKAGIAGVLADVEQNPFSQKRMCIMMREEGFDFVGKDYVKEMRHGKEVKREPLKDEAAYREALKQVAGITL